IGGAVSFAAFLLAGSSLVGLWVGILLKGLFTFAESPQLQALLAAVADPRLRDTSFALYFTLAFGVGSLWTFVYGRITDGLGDVVGLPVVCGVMAFSFVRAALAVVPIREGGTRSPASEAL